MENDSNKEKFYQASERNIDRGRKRKKKNLLFRVTRNAIIGVLIVVAFFTIVTEYKSFGRVQKSETVMNTVRQIAQSEDELSTDENNTEDLYGEASETKDRVNTSEDGEENIKNQITDTLDYFLTLEEVRITKEGLTLLEEINPDICGWISIPDTKINYPVMCNSCDLEYYYLSHDFYKNSDDCGLPELCSLLGTESFGDNIIIYGNNCGFNYMFSALSGYKNEEFYKSHPYIRFDTLERWSSFEIVSVMIMDESCTASDYDEIFSQYVTFDSEDEFMDFYVYLQENSLYDTGVKASFGDQLITLCTCDYYARSGKVVVVGRRMS